MVETLEIDEKHDEPENKLNEMTVSDFPPLVVMPQPSLRMFGIEALEEMVRKYGETGDDDDLAELQFGLSLLAGKKR